jgi:hypothetical protein
VTDNVVVTFPTPKHVLITRLRDAIARTKKGREEWIGGMVDQAITLMEARAQFPTDNNSFAVWLAENEVDEWNKDNRAALINLAKSSADRSDLVFLFDKFADDRWQPNTIWLAFKEKRWQFAVREFERRVQNGGGLSNHSNTPDPVYDPPENDAEAPTTAILSVSDSPPATEISSISRRPTYAITDSKGQTIKDLSKTALARTFGLSAADVEALLSAYVPGPRQALSAELVKLHHNQKTRKRAHDLIRLAVEVAKAGKAPNLKNTMKSRPRPRRRSEKLPAMILVLDARMFWPYLPEAFCKYLDNSAPNLAKQFDRLTLVNAKAAEMAARGASAHDTHNEINHLWAHGTERPKSVPKTVIIPEHSKIKHEVKFCGEIVWPSDLLKATDADLNTGWHLVHHWISYLETAKPQKPNEIAVILAHLIADIGEASSKDGLVAVMRACLAAFLKVNNNAPRADLSNSTAPGLKI